MDCMHATPVNAQAAREMRASKPERKCSRTCPPLHPEDLHVVRDRVGKLHDLTGWPFGAAKVVGFFQWPGKWKHSLWVVRCACGNYETVTARTIMGHRATELRRPADHRPWVCSECHNLRA
jgi:hypothetical protein